jgi:hypothetical protein
MTPSYDKTRTSPQTAQSDTNEGRWAEVAILDALRQAQAAGGSLLQVAQKHNIPEATVRHWVARAQASGAPDAFVQFVETPVGLEVLHRIVTAATYVMTQVIGGGVRPLCQFLELSGLWRVVAAGYGTQQQAVKAMEEAIVAFGAHQKESLAKSMVPRQITVTQDETFHAEPCLVASEPVSNFILVEEHAEDRKAQTWDDAMKRGLEGLPVTVIQSTSDEGTALLSHAKSGLEAHHSPDLFHPQQDISRATSLPLKRQIEAAQRVADQAAEAVDAVQYEADQYHAQDSCRLGRPRDYDRRIEQASQVLDEAELAVVEAKQRRKRVREAARGISSAYHPFDLTTGALRDASTVKAELECHHETILSIADEAGLSAKCVTLLRKVQRLIPQMAATIAFVHTLIQHKVEALELDKHVELQVKGTLIPMYYLEEVARKASTAEARAQPQAQAATLRSKLESPPSELARLDASERDAVHNVARQCAQLFQRSSSNVEGRNGFLALRNHSTHHLSPRKLGALTVVHNYGIVRSDGTTAAQRFFGQRHPSLFEHLLACLPPPKRPAERRRAVN